MTDVSFKYHERDRTIYFSLGNDVANKSSPLFENPATQDVYYKLGGSRERSFSSGCSFSHENGATIVTGKRSRVGTTIVYYYRESGSTYPSTATLDVYGKFYNNDQAREHLAKVKPEVEFRYTTEMTELSESEVPQPYAFTFERGRARLLRSHIHERKDDPNELVALSVASGRMSSVFYDKCKIRLKGIKF